MSDPSAPQDPFAGVPPEPDASNPPPYGSQPPASPPPYGSPPAPYGSPPPAPYGSQPPAYGSQPPAYGSQPAYGAAPGGYQPASMYPKNSLAVWSLVLGIVSFVMCGLFSAIPAIIVGAKAKKAVAEGEANNGTMATAGIILGWVAVALSVIGIIIVIIAIATGNGNSSYSTYSNL